MMSGLVDCFKDSGKFLSGVVLIVLVLALCFSGIALGIADIVIGAKWKECYLNDDSADIYLIVSGALLLACVMLVGNSKTNNEEEEKHRSRGLYGLVTTASFGVLIWGMTIVWDSEQGDCDKGQYNYLYYRTIVIMFMGIGIVALGLLAVIGLGAHAIALG